MKKLKDDRTRPRNSLVRLALVHISKRQALKRRRVGQWFGQNSQPSPFNPDGPMVSPGAYVIRILAKDDPALAELADQVESAERRLMKQAIDANRPKQPTDRTSRAFSKLPSQGTNSEPLAMSTSLARPVTAHFMFQSAEHFLPTTGDGMFFGAFTGYLKGQLTAATTDEHFNTRATRTEPVEGGSSTMTSEVGINPDGSSVLELGMKTETVKNGVKVTTEFKSRIEGQDCPNAEGQVPITVKLRLAGVSGSSRYEQDVTAFARVVVDDNADIVSTTIDVTQATSRGRNGNDVFVETGGTFRHDADQSEYTKSNGRIVQHTDNATGTDVTEAAMSGNSVALGAANAAIGAAESAWKGGRA
jgi:hypothetical protein